MLNEKLQNIELIDVAVNVIAPKEKKKMKNTTRKTTEFILRKKVNMRSKTNLIKEMEMSFANVGKFSYFLL